MKALTLTQPWATLVAIGAKTIETRSWRTFHSGPLAIHAAKGFPRWAMELVHDEEVGRPFRDVLKAAGVATLKDLPLGAIVAMCRLNACVSTTTMCDHFDGIVTATALPVGEHEQAFGDYGSGRYAWLLADVVALPTPISARGSLGLWEWDDAEIGMPIEPASGQMEMAL